MALSFNTVQIAYQVFGQLKKEVLPELSIPSWPEDMGEWEQTQQKNPPTLKVLGWGKKYDNGWESLAFFIKDPSPEVINMFDELKGKIKANTSLNEVYHKNEKLWIIGWF